MVEGQGHLVTDALSEGNITRVVGFTCVQRHSEWTGKKRHVSVSCSERGLGV